MVSTEVRQKKRKNLLYWIVFTAGAVVLLGAAVAIYHYRGNLATWQLEEKQARLWDVVLKAVAGSVAIIGALITASKYIDEKVQQREQDWREKRKDFLQEQQAVYGRLGRSLARIMNHDPGDTDWNLVKEEFYEIYWGEIPLVADEAVMNLLKEFSDKPHEAKTKENKEALREQVEAITKACRKSLEDEWKDIKKAEE